MVLFQKTSEVFLILNSGCKYEFIEIYMPIYYTQIKTIASTIQAKIHLNELGKFKKKIY